MNRRVSAEPIALDIENFTHDGRGVARVDGKAIFVSGALVGERVVAKLTAKHRQYDEAEVIEILQASPDRVVPGCAHFGICSGCVNEISRPGITASTESNTVTSPSWSFAVVHSSCGLRMTYMSPSKSPIASVARSGRPSLVTTVITSGNFRMIRSDALESRVASASEMLGNLIAGAHFEWSHQDFDPDAGQVGQVRQNFSALLPEIEADYRAWFSAMS